MEFGGTTSGEAGIKWLKAAMIVCFASAAGVMAYAITTTDAAPPALTNGPLKAAIQN